MSKSNHSPRHIPQNPSIFVELWAKICFQPTLFILQYDQIHYINFIFFIINYDSPSILVKSVLETSCD